MIYLLNVNFWLAIAFQSHIHHVSAKQWFDRLSLPENCVFCRLTQQGFLRLATNPKAFHEEAVTLDVAWRMYDRLLADPRISFVQEPVEIEGTWRRFTLTRMVAPKVWNDAYLAAFAHEAGIQLVTFDQDYRQYTDVGITILS
jgi:toxin-antitoxin system PIN domain toxin